jgi:hypothetical protein
VPRAGRSIRGRPLEVELCQKACFFPDNRAVQLEVIRQTESARERFRYRALVAILLAIQGSPLVDIPYEREWN